MMIRGRAVMAGAVMVVFAACAGGDAGEEAEAPAASQPEAPAAQQPAAPTVGANVQFPEGVTQEMAAQGQQLFNQGLCWTCHGMDGTGGPLAPVLADQEWLNVDGEYENIVQVIQTGVPTPKQFSAPMPPMGGSQLTEEQVRQLAAYVYAISHGS